MNVLGSNVVGPNSLCYIEWGFSVQAILNKFRQTGRTPSRLKKHT